MEVTLRPLKRDAWAGVHKYKTCTDSIGTYWTRSGQVYTGLTEENATRLGQKLGYLLIPTSEFWSNFYIRVSNKDIYLDTSDPMDELRYLFLKNHKRVRDGFSDNNPYADYVLINKEVEAEVINKYNQVKRKALKEFDKLTTVDQKKALRLYGHRSDNLTSELVEQKLFDIVEKDPEKFLEIWVNNKRRETQYLIQEAIGKNVLRRNKSEYKYGTDTIGYTLEDAIDFLDAAEHRDIKAIIINDVNAK